MNAGLRLRYFADEAFANREQDRLHAFVEDLARHAGHDGESSVRPPSPAGSSTRGRAPSSSTRGLSLEHGRDSVALQMLWCWALRSAERVLARTGHPGASRWGELASRLEATLRERAWLPRHGRWADYLDARRSKRPATYANFLAVLAEMHEEVPTGVRDAVRSGTSGTPFMTAFRLRALIAAGEPAAAVDEVRRTWGAMLDRGPGTFWEESSMEGDPLEMYGRPFGRVAATRGPRVLLPPCPKRCSVSGRSTTDGRASPCGRNSATWTGPRRWCPRPVGDLVVVADRERVTVHVPSGAVLVRDGHSVPGPSVVEWTVRPGVDAGRRTVSAPAS